MVFGTSPPSSAFEDSDLHVVVIGRSRVARLALPRKPSVTFGRAATADLVVDDESVAPAHAVLHLGAGCVLEDLGGSSSTAVNGRRLPPGGRAAILPGAAFELGAVTIVLQRARVYSQASPEVSSARLSQAPAVSGGSDRAPVVVDPAMRSLYAMLDRFAPSSLAVLILGETGTGKEVFAKEVHARSTRAASAFVAINCAALTPSLVDSELFGHEKGAFTGAVSAKIGLFEEAHGGSVFLDELGDLPLTTQAKLLRVLESGEFLRVGSAKPQRVDVRLLAATNADVDDLLVTGRLRRDLFFRLNGFTATLPPLRDRPADIMPLARFFAAHASERGGRPIPAFTAEAEEILLQQAWPGNARELRNVVERAAMLVTDGVIDAHHLAVDWLPRRPMRSDVAPIASPEQPSDLSLNRAENERRRIEEALRRTSGNQTEAAKLLGISRRALLNKLDRFGFGRPRKDTRAGGRR